MPLTQRLPTDWVQHIDQRPRRMAGGTIGWHCSPFAPAREPSASQTLTWIKRLLSSAKSPWCRNIPVLTRTNLELPDRRMNVVPLDRSDDTEPEWPRVGLHGCDFRPHFDGYLHNLFTTIHPLQLSQRPNSFFAALQLRWQNGCFQTASNLGQATDFIDRCWPLDVRAHGRQVIKTGGDYNTIQQLIDDQELVQVRKRWAESVFTNNEIG